MDRSVRSVNINPSPCCASVCACERVRARGVVSAPRGADGASFSLNRRSRVDDDDDEEEEDEGQGSFF